jgi:hypothetical protein
VQRANGAADRQLVLLSSAPARLTAQLLPGNSLPHQLQPGHGRGAARGDDPLGVHAQDARDIGRLHLRNAGPGPLIEGVPGQDGAASSSWSRDLDDGQAGLFDVRMMDGPHAGHDVPALVMAVSIGGSSLHLGRKAGPARTTVCVLAG